MMLSFAVHPSAAFKEGFLASGCRVHSKPITEVRDEAAAQGTARNDSRR